MAGLLSCGTTLYQPGPGGKGLASPGGCIAESPSAEPSGDHVERGRLLAHDKKTATVDVGWHKMSASALSPLPTAALTLNGKY
jgi:hypothetical protein